MSRKPTFSLAYTHDVFGSMVGQAFTVPTELPPSMRAILDQLDSLERKDWSLAERLEGIRVLAEAEA